MNGRPIGRLLATADGGFAAAIFFSVRAPEGTYAVTATEQQSPALRTSTAARSISLVVTLARGANLATVPAANIPQFQALPTIYLPMLWR